MSPQCADDVCVVVSFDPFAGFEEPAPAPTTPPAPAAPATAVAPVAVAQVSHDSVIADPFAMLDLSAAEPAPQQPEFKVSLASEAAPQLSSSESKSGFANAHMFASPDHPVGENPSRIPVTPIKGDASGVPLDAITTPSAAPHASAPTSSATASSSAPSSSSTAAAAASASAVATSASANKPSLEMAGELEKLAEGFLGEKWNLRWCGVKHNRFGYYNSKADPRPKGFVFFDEADVGIPQNLAQSAEYQYAFQISHERKNLNWFFRAPNQEVMKKWLATMSANIKHYKQLNAEPTILERVMSVACVKDQVTVAGVERSFHFYTSKSSSGFYAVVLCVLMELLVRKIIDLVNTDELCLAANATFTGIGLFDDVLDLIAAKVKQSPSKSVKISEMMPIFLYGGGLVGSLGYSLGPDSFLQDPVLRAIDHSTRRGTLEKIGPKRWIVKNTQMEEQLMSQLNSLISTPYSGTDVKDHLVIGICYTLLRAASKSPGADQNQHDVLDRGKIFPNFVINSQVEAALDKIAKNLGSFEKKQATLLKCVHSALTDFILGPAPK